MNKKIKNIFNVGLSLLIVMDLVLLTLTLIFNLPNRIYNYIIIFDTIICIILLIEFFYRLKKSENKRRFFVENWTELIAAIPFDLLMLPVVLNYARFLRILRVLKFIKIFSLFSQFFESIDVFLKKTYLDEIFGIFAFVIIVFTLGLYVFDPSMNNLFDSLWFVLVTLTTVGYGDIIPNSTIGKVISLILLIVGVILFSAVTGAMASYFTKKIFHADTLNTEFMNDDEESLELKNKLNEYEVEIKELKQELKETKEIANDLKQELNEIKDLLKNK